MKIIPVGASVILPAAQMASDMLGRFEVFANSGNTVVAQALRVKSKDNSQGITLTSCAEMIKAMYLDMLQDVSYWGQLIVSESNVTIQWRRMIKDWDELSADGLQRDLFNEVLREAYEEIHDWTLRLDGGRPQWNVWFARRLGFDILLERGEDYRILDWKRRMDLGKTAQEAEEQKEELPPGAWIFDAEAERFVELLKGEQSENGVLSMTKAAQYSDHQSATQRLNKIKSPKSSL